MKIQNTDWKTVAVKSEKGGDYELGYETKGPATEEQLRQLQKLGILVQVVGKTQNDMPQFIQPDNTDSRHFSSDQKFRIMETNSTFGRFEQILWGEYLPDNRFDECINWVDPNMYGKTDRGYSLKLSNLLSYEKKQELKENLVGYATMVRSDKIFVSGQKNVEAIEFLWKEASKQKKLTKRLHEATKQTVLVTTEHRKREY